MSETFDIGPLTWVKDQINQSLDVVLGNLNTVLSNVHDTAPLRFSQTHLYQATGALDMVGLEGCKRFCSELEKLAAKLEKKTVDATPELIQAFIKAVDALKVYLQDLLNGSPDVPLRLYSILSPIVLAQGETIEESELFFPDTSNSAPKDLSAKQLSDADYAIFMAEQRLGYQKSLLNWLTCKQDAAIQNAAVQNMTMAVTNVSQAQQKNSHKTLWWAASAFTESLEQKEIADNIGAKKLCRKLDQELKQLTEGVSKPHSSLLRDILYFVALSDVERDNVQKVKEVFELDALIDKKSAHFDASNIDATEMALVQQLLSELETLREQWDDVSNTIDFTKVEANASHAQVDVDNVLITKFADTLAASHAHTQQLSQVVVVDLYAALQQAINTLRDDNTKVNHAALIEIAASLNLLDTSLNHYQHLDADRVQKLLSEMRRLEAISSGESYDKFDIDRTGELDRDTIKAVVTQIKESLKIVEQALDSYFRNPKDNAPLSLIPRPIKQVSAVFDMLGLNTPSAITNACGHFSELFQQDDYVPNQAHFELIAESLSMIGLYADEMPKTRPESEKALEAALQRLIDAGVEPPKQALETTNQAAKLVQAIDVPAVLITNDMVADHKPAQIIIGDNDVKVIDQAFDPELLDIYLTEAEEVLANIAQNCQALRVNATDSEALIELRRSYHTLKGSGRTVGLTGLGEIAGQVEVFLNGVMDKKSNLNIKQIVHIEQISAAFASWASDLRANDQVEINHTAWLSYVAELPNLSMTNVIDLSPAFKADVANTISAKKISKKPEPLVLIGGTRKMSRALYDIFMKESMQNITLLEQDSAKIIAEFSKKPALNAKVAAHTLASNALAAEFTQMGLLGRALETWLDETQGFSRQQTDLYASVIKSLSAMWQRVSELKNPRSAKSLIDLLNRATEQGKVKSNTATFKKLVPLEIVKTTAKNAENKVNKKSGKKVNVVNEYVTEDSFAALEKTEPLMPVLAQNVEQDLLTAPGADALFEAKLESFIVVDNSLNALADNEQVQAQIDTLYEANPDDFEVRLATESMLFPSVDLNVQNTNSTGFDRAEVDQELLTMFIEEAREILPEVGAELRAWRSAPKQTGHADALQRSLHTLKGSARMAGQSGLGDAVHELEDHVIRSLKRKAEPADFDNMFADLDKIGNFFEQTIGNTPAEKIATVKAVDAPPAGRTNDRKATFLRMRADTLDRLINDAGEISIIRSRMDREISGVKQSSNDLTESVTRLRSYLRELEIEAETQMQSRMSILQEANETFDPLEFDRFTRLQELTRMIAESVNDVATIQYGMLTNLGQSEAALQQQNRMNRDLQQTLLGIRMLPFRQISERMQRIVRQTARELKKQVELVIEGETTDIDRGVLDKLGPPLEHLLRNSVAHGIEMPADRKKARKPETGVITLRVSQENDEISITISDDGAGVDIARVKAKAIKNKFIDAGADIAEQALLAIIFEPGFSTADKVSQISGRGVGLDVVRNDISSLGGRVDITSDFGKGATFAINLPVTLSVAQVLLVRTADAVYGLPVGMIEQAQKIKRAELAKIYEAGEVVWADKHYPLHYLPKLLDHNEHTPEDQAYTSILLLRVGTYNIALHVDDVVNNQEVVMKPIGSQLARVPGIVGATVAGDGSIMLIINPVQLVAREILSAGSVNVRKVKLETVLTKYTVLVVDDSLTMRKVLARLLEREGFNVLVAKDGMDAMQVLLENTPDAILTDIEMPRMDGFGLARNIRDDARTAGTPLIMISSRTADKHQNLAKEIGVDAFFGKPVADDDLVRKVLELIESRKQLH